MINLYLSSLSKGISCISCNLQVQEAIFNDKFCYLLSIMLIPSMIVSLGLLALYYKY